MKPGLKTYFRAQTLLMAALLQAAPVFAAPAAECMELNVALETLASVNDPKKQCEASEAERPRRDRTYQCINHYEDALLGLKSSPPKGMRIGMNTGEAIALKGALEVMELTSDATASFAPAIPLLVLTNSVRMGLGTYAKIRRKTYMQLLEILNHAKLMANGGLTESQESYLTRESTLALLHRELVGRKKTTLSLKEFATRISALDRSGELCARPVKITRNGIDAETLDLIVNEKSPD